MEVLRWESFSMWVLWRRHHSCRFLLHFAALGSLTALVLLLSASLVAQEFPEQKDSKDAHVFSPAWQIAAGGRLKFEVASVRPADPDHVISPSFSLSVEDGPVPKTSDFIADFPLPTLISFAYKVLLQPKQ